MNRDSVDGILSRLRSGQPRKIGPIPGRGKKLFSSPKGPPIRWLLGELSPGVKRTRREADYLRLVLKLMSRTVSPLAQVHRENFVILLQMLHVLSI
jgi:hypothetical protein